MADNDNVQADPRDTDPRDFTAIYNTPLTPPEEDSFQGWMKDQSDKSGRDVSKDLYDYDLRGYWRANAGDTEEGPQLAGGPPETRAHLTDDYKKPNHMTFSTGSIWHGLAGNEGGTWEKRDDGSYLFTPGKNNRGFYSSDDMNRYFDKVERTHGNDIRLPGTEAPAPPPAPPGIQMQNGRVTPSSLYGHLVKQFSNSPLNGYVPRDGARFGITKGTPEEWAQFGLAVARQESGFNPRSTNLNDPGGSFGLFQFNQRQYGLHGNAYDPTASANAFVKSAEDLVSDDHGIAGMGATFGSIRRPGETTQHLPFARNIASAAGDEPAALPTGAPSDAFEAAAARVRGAVQPAGGRQEGIGTDLATKFIPGLAHSLIIDPINTGAELLQRSVGGEDISENPEEIPRAFQAAGVIAPGHMPFAEPGALGAGGGRMKIPAPPEPAPELPAPHPDRINTRLVTSKKAVPTDEAQDVSMEAMRATPKLYEKNVGVVRDYPNVREEIAQGGTTDEVAEHFIDHVKKNLLWLHDQIPDAIRQRSQLWYEGGNKIVKDWAQKYGISESSAAGVIASMSPQKDWFQNVSLAERVLDTLRGQGQNFYRGFTTTPEMEQTFKRIGFDKKTGEIKEDWQPMWDRIKGRSLSDIDEMNETPDVKAGLKALWVRLHDQAHRSSSYRLVSPEGEFGDVMRNADGRPSKMAWGSLTEISKAIRAIESPEEMQTLMGEKHKVRNFYNNLLDPNGPMGDVTIDTHAVAAGLLRPLSGNSIEVSHNFANYAGKGKPGVSGSAETGIQGTYPLYAEAYRRAAAERGILPRQMQSITWEAARGMFPDTFKTDKNVEAIDAMWNRYRAGKQSLNATRKQVLDATGGIRPPDWFAPGHSLNIR